MKRGDVVVVAARGDYTGKPRPAVILQADDFADHDSLTVAPFSTALLDIPLLRLLVAPTSENGLRELSEIMIDKIWTVPRARIGKQIGSMDAVIMNEVDRALAVFLGIA